VISSDLQRAAETARATGFDLELSAGFREFDVGRWEGLTREEVTERFPDEIQRLKHGEDVPLGGGESYASFAKRIDGEVARLRASLAPGEHALVVCHGGVIGTALSGLLGLRAHGHWPFTRISNTSISEVVWGADDVELRVYNDALHLRPLGQYPSRDDVSTAVALVADEEPDGLHGEFSAQWDARAPGPVALGALERLLYALPDVSPDPELVHAAVLELATTHPEQRVALCLRAALIHAFAEDALWSGKQRTARLAPPSRGALCHVASIRGQSTLLDYGVSI
jgi:broad specificity phosphatase PhoE